ncbi:MAG: response regulator transcription factor [Clostridium sp.]|nr:response regulator transcription factor [Clostridium sp.]
MFCIAVCCKEKEKSYYIEDIILKNRDKFPMLIEIDVYNFGKDLYKKLLDGIRYDMIFLDVELRDINGVSIGDKIRNELRDNSVQIVYMGNSVECTINLFKIRPINFLVKPIKDEDVIYSLEKVFELSYDYMFYYKIGHKIKRQKIDDILYFESFDRKVEMVTLNKRESFYESLNNIYSILKFKGFFFCHKSFLVNHNRVEEFEYEKLKLSNGTILPVSQSKRKYVKKIYENCLNKAYNNMHLEMSL